MDPTPHDVFDAFATLGLERRLALADVEIESAWQTLSRESHPDAESGNADRAAAVNRARGLLLSPGQRLRHWLELEGIVLPRHGAIDPGLMDLFSEVGAILAEADEVRKRRAAAGSALARALLAEAEIAAQQKLQALLGKLQRERGAIADQFPAIEAAAQTGNYSLALASAARLGFVVKWEQQAQERLLSLIADG